MKRRIRTGNKLYVVRTYVLAKHAQDALKKAREKKPDDVYVSDDWKEGKITNLSDAIGFDDGVYEEEEEV